MYMIRYPLSSDFGSNIVYIMKIGRQEVLSLVDAGERLGVSAHTLRRSVLRGTLQGVKIGKTWLVTVEEVERYERENKGKPGRKKKAGADEADTTPNR